MYINDFKSEPRTQAWTVEVVDHFRQMDKDENLNGGYGEEGAADIRRHIKEHMARHVEGERKT